MTQKEFFKRYGNSKISHIDQAFTIEEIYRMFRERLIDEIIVDVPGTSHYGGLFATESLLQGK